MFGKQPAGYRPDGRAVPHPLTDVPDHAVADHGGNRFIAFTIDPPIGQDGRNAAVGAFDCFNCIPLLVWLNLSTFVTAMYSSMSSFYFKNELIREWMDIMIVLWSFNLKEISDARTARLPKETVRKDALL